jgi:hypothetical protein
MKRLLANAAGISTFKVRLTGPASAGTVPVTSITACPV